MTACVREIHNLQYSWLVLDSKLLDKVTYSYKEGKKLDVQTLCQVLPWKDIVSHKSAVDLYQLEELVACSMQLTLHFVMQNCLHSATRKQQLILTAPVPMNVALAIAGYNCKRTANTVLGTRGEHRGIELKSNPPTWEILEENMQSALLHHEIRTQKDVVILEGSVLQTLKLEDGLARFKFAAFQVRENKALQLLQNSRQSNPDITIINDILREKLRDPIFIEWLAHNMCDERKDEGHLLSLLKKDVLSAHKSRNDMCETTASNANTLSNVNQNEIQQNDNGTYNAILQHFQEKHLNNALIPDEGSSRPIVTQFQLPAKISESFSPQIIGIENAMGRDYIDEIINLYSQTLVLFHRGVKGREASYLWFVTLEDPHGRNGRIAYFQIGIGPTAARYVCQKATH